MILIDFIVILLLTIIAIVVIAFFAYIAFFVVLIGLGLVLGVFQGIWGLFKPIFKRKKYFA